MKKLLSIALCTLATSIANMAECSPKYYVKGEAGSGMPSNSTLRKNEQSGSPLFSIGIGAKFTKKLRADLNLRYKYQSWQFSDNNLSLKQYSVLLNMYYDFYKHCPFTTYITGGIGYRMGRANLQNISTSKVCPPASAGAPIACDPNTSGVLSTSISPSKPKLNGLMWNLGFGAKIRLCDSTALDLSYRFMGSPKSNSSLPQVYKDLASHELTVGVIYKL